MATSSPSATSSTTTSSAASSPSSRTSTASARCPAPNTWKESGSACNGLLFDLGPHLLDQALALFGAPESITASVRSDRDTTDIEDAFDIVLHYPRLLAICRSTMLATRPRAALPASRHPGQLQEVRSRPAGARARRRRSRSPPFRRPQRRNRPLARRARSRTGVCSRPRLTPPSPASSSRARSKPTSATTAASTPTSATPSVAPPRSPSPRRTAIAPSACSSSPAKAAPPSARLPIEF